MHARRFSALLDLLWITDCSSPSPRRPWHQPPHAGFNAPRPPPHSPTRHAVRLTLNMTLGNTGAPQLRRLRLSGIRKILIRCRPQRSQHSNCCSPSVLSSLTSLDAPTWYLASLTSTSTHLFSTSLRIAYFLFSSTTVAYIILYDIRPTSLTRGNQQDSRHFSRSRSPHSLDPQATSAATATRSLKMTRRTESSSSPMP